MNQTDLDKALHSLFILCKRTSCHGENMKNAFSSGLMDLVHSAETPSCVHQHSEQTFFKKIHSDISLTALSKVRFQTVGSLKVRAEEATGIFLHPRESGTRILTHRCFGLCLSKWTQLNLVPLLKRESGFVSLVCCAALLTLVKTV